MVNVNVTKILKEPLVMFQHALKIVNQMVIVEEYVIKIWNDVIVLMVGRVNLVLKLLVCIIRFFPILYDMDKDILIAFRS